MPNAQMNFRIDAELKRRGDDRFTSLGYSPSEAVRRFYECAARYDDESEKVLTTILKPEGLTSSEEGEKRAKAIYDFQESLLRQRMAIGALSKFGSPPPTDEELEELYHEAQIEKMQERGLW